MTTSLVDTYLVYSLVKRLVQPFESWEAYKLGVIDGSGNILIDKKDRNLRQKNSLQLFDIMIMNLKKLLAKLPGGNSRFATYSAALFLLKEDSDDAANFVEYMRSDESYNLYKLFSEDAPTNAVGSGHVAGATPDTVFVKKKDKKKVVRRSYQSLLK